MLRPDNSSCVFVYFVGMNSLLSLQRDCAGKLLETPLNSGTPNADKTTRWPTPTPLHTYTHTPRHNTVPNVLKH